MKSKLEREHPWHHEFLKWHKEMVLKKYRGPVAVDLISKAKDWVVRDLRFVRGGESFG